jgi:hypothetical protein
MTSADALFACFDCHTEFAEVEHPKRNFQSHEQYKIRTSLTCRRCHTDEQIRTRPVHIDILSREKRELPRSVPIATAHSIIRVTKRSRSVMRQSSAYGATGSISVVISERRTTLHNRRPRALEASVHNKLSCSDCHYGFSSEEHPNGTSGHEGI